MSEIHNIKVIARLRSDFKTKFGVPRQSGLVDELHATVVFEPEYRNTDAVRGLEEFSHIWLVWQFSGAVRSDWSPTVRPPRLGGNKRIGVLVLLTFLQINGKKPKATNDEIISLGLGIADGSLTYDDVLAWTEKRI